MVRSNRRFVFASEAAAEAMETLFLVSCFSGERCLDERCQRSADSSLGILTTEFHPTFSQITWIILHAFAGGKILRTAEKWIGSSRHNYDLNPAQSSAMYYELRRGMRYTDWSD